MKLSLARWEDEHGDSAGYWLIREIPGVYLEHKFLGGWEVQIITFPDDVALAGTVMQAPVDTWGYCWEPNTELYDSLPKAVRGPHASRSQALMKLEAHLAEGVESAAASLIM